MIKKEKWTQLIEMMKALNITALDITEQFITASGRGGQKVNKTASAVFLKHLPSGLIVKCQKSRFREDNRYFARLKLCEKLKAIQDGEQSELNKKINRIRRQKKRRARRIKSIKQSDD